MRERLMELIIESDILCDTCGESSPSYCAEAIADYLLENGIIVPPCKVGDTVYIIRECSCHVYGQWESSDPIKKCSKKVFLGQKRRAYHCGFVVEAKFELRYIDEFEKSVFLTREEAERVLNERAAAAKVGSKKKSNTPWFKQGEDLQKNGEGSGSK